MPSKSLRPPMAKSQLDMAVGQIVILSLLHPRREHGDGESLSLFPSHFCLSISSYL